MNTQEYRKNRGRFTITDLGKYRGRWVAVSQDGAQIVASSDDLVALDRLVVAEGEDLERIALERIECDDVYLGPAEHD